MDGTFSSHRERDSNVSIEWFLRDTLALGGGVSFKFFVLLI